MSGKFSFPLLNLNEVISCLTELGISVNEQQFLKPSPQEVRFMFERFVEILMGVNPEELAQPQFSALHTLEFPELHEESIGTLAMTRNLFKLMECVGVHDFSLKDVMKPEADRLRRCFSGLINFAKFREERLEVYKDAEAKTDELQDSKNQLWEQNVELAAEYKMLRTQLQSEEPQAQALNEDMERLAAQISELNSQQSDLQKEIRNLKATNTTLGDEIANKKFELLNARQDCTKLKASLVQSPMRVKREMEDLRVTIDSDKETAAEFEKRDREFVAKLDRATKLEKDLKKAFATTEEIAREIARFKEVSKTSKFNQSEIEKHESELRELISSQQLLNRQVQAAQDRLHRLDQQHNQKTTSMKNQLEESKIEKQKLEREKASDNHVLTQLDDMAREITHKTQLLTNGHQQKINLMNTRFSQMNTQVKDYHRSLLQSLRQGGC